MTSRTSAAFSVLVGLSVIAGAARAEKIFPYKISEKVLSNGLQVVVVPYESPGTVSYMTVVRTGSRDEVEPGHSGFAHFFEHMMFRGTDKYDQDEYNDVLKRMGADSNASTSDDRTRYYIIGPSAELEAMMDIESDRFKNLEYSEEDFRREALAVLGEYNKNISNPFLPMYEKMRELAFEKHTYSHTTMGYLDDIKAMPDYYDYSLRFFDRFYRPENCALVVTGDADPDQVFALAEKYWGDWKAGYEAPSIAEEPPQSEPREAAIDWPSPINPHLMIGYRAPAFSDSTPATAALDLFSQVLFGESAPLYQKLVVEEQWVDFVSGSYSDHRDPYLFMIYTRVKSGELVPKVLEAIDDAIATAQSTLVDAAELERIKSHLRYQFALGLDTPGSIGFMLTNFLTLSGDTNTVNNVYEQYAKVSPEDIQSVAKKIFQDSNRTKILLSHTPESAADASTGR
ncbi:MAG: M16 family metallopeptidase [Thermoanaerobaculia bacterium]